MHLEQVLISDEPGAGNHETASAPPFSPGPAGRLVVEHAWVEALLRLCGRDMRPADRQRWLAKYEEDSAALERAIAASWRTQVAKRWC
jgi:hypothetical protein